MVCTVRGWNLLTQPADFTMFPHSQLALQKHVSKKNRKESPPENQTPAADAAGKHMGGGGNDDHPADTAQESIAERADSLGSKSKDGENGSGASETHGFEFADGTEGTDAE
jgi:hypothetical protein